MAETKRAEAGGHGMATSLRVYLEIESEEQAHGVAERIADLLSELGYNRDDRMDAVIACVAEAPDVEAWAEGIEPFIASLRGAGFVLLPQPEETKPAWLRTARRAIVSRRSPRSLGEHPCALQPHEQLARAQRIVDALDGRVPEPLEKRAMAENSEQVEQGTNRLVAADWCEVADQAAADRAFERAQAFAAVGQLYASLAIAERLEEIGRQINYLTGGGR